MRGPFINVELTLQVVGIDSLAGAIAVNLCLGRAKVPLRQRFADFVGNAGEGDYRKKEKNGDQAEKHGLMINDNPGRGCERGVGRP